MVLHNKAAASPACRPLTEDFVVVEDAPPPPPPIESPVSPALSDQRRELADVIAKNRGIAASVVLSRRRRADAFKRWASRHRTEHTNGSKAPSSRRNGPWTRGGRSSRPTPGGGGGGSGLRRVLGTWRAQLSAVDVVAAEALRDELDDMREQLGKVTERDAAKADGGGGGDAPRRARECHRGTRRRARSSRRRPRGSLAATSIT